MKFVWKLLAWLGIASLLMPLLAFAFLRFLLAPVAGEWTTQVKVGPVEMSTGVPSLIRLATSSWVAPHLDGHSWPTSAGRLQFRWLADSKALVVRCAPCTLRMRGIGDEPLVLPQLDITVQRDFSDLQGLIEAGNVRGSWQAHLDTSRVRVAVDIPPTPAADGYALFAASIPELQRAQINGRFSLRADINLPNGELSVKPQLDGFTVTGLNTGALADARSSCTAVPPNGKAPQPIPIDGWLARAVIAAEDQKFWDHGGFDMAELQAALQANREQGRIARGGSTLPQQLAKLLVTGAERSPTRKLRELLYAADMEQSLGKPRILRLYLENAPWGPGVCGAHAAARTYFNRDVKSLTPSQAVWLAAMLHNPGMEVQRWAGSGQVDVVRAQWVAQGVRGISRRQRNALLDEMRQIKEAPIWVAPQR